MIMDLEDGVATARLYRAPKIYLRIAHFADDNQCCNFTNFGKAELFFLMNKLGLTNKII